MKTNLVAEFQNTAEGLEAESILRACVHCGFCTATCPTYQELNDERDGPRGRIYLMKMFLEGAEVTEKTREHLDRCLTCRSCETTCPSGVQYGRLVDISRVLIDKELPRAPKDKWMRGFGAGSAQPGVVRIHAAPRADICAHTAGQTARQSAAQKACQPLAGRKP